MRNAICLSGRPYGLVECAPYIIKNVIEPNNCDVFIHAWHNVEAEGTRYRPNSKYIGRVPIAAEQQLREIYKPKMIFVQPQLPFSTEGYDSIYQPGDKRFIFSIFSMLYSIQRCNQLKLFYEQAYNFKYDAVCRCRFDLVIQNCVNFDLLNLSKINLKDDCKHEEGCCNDHFAVSNSANMDIYSNLFHVIPILYHHMKTPFCNEIFLGRYLAMKKLEKVGINVQWKQLHEDSTVF